MDYETNGLVVGQTYAKIVKDDEGNYYVIDENGQGPACKFCEENDKTIVLTPNLAKRQFFSRAKADKEIAEKGYAELTYRTLREPGTQTRRLPNEKLIAYLPEDLQKEYKALVAKAFDAMAAAKAAAKAPKSDIEKAQERLNKAKALYEKLLAESTTENI